MREAIRIRGSLCALVVLTTLAFARPGLALVVSEIMYHPAEDASGEESLEFIELYNNRAVSEYLGGWAFTNGIEYTFEPNTVLGPKSYLVIAKDPNTLMALYGVTGVLGPYSGKLNNDGERIELSTPGGMRVLSFRYNDAGPWPVSPDGAGHSLILAKYAGDPEVAGSWSPSTYIGGTPGGPDESQAGEQASNLMTLVNVGTKGRYFKGTEEPSPDAAGAPSTAWTEVGFNDDPAATAWREGASGYGYSNDVTELQYVGTQLEDMRGNYASIYARLRFTLTASQAASMTQLMAEIYYDDAYVLYLNGVRVSDSESISGNPPAFDTLADTQIDNVSMTFDLQDKKDLLLAGENVLAIQIHNGSLSSSDCFAGVVLRGTVEQLDAGDDPDVRLVVNELQAGSTGTDGDWIELYNPGPASVRLSNVYLSDDRVDLLQCRLPDVTLQPGQFWTVSQSDEGFPFALDSSGETIYVTAATGDSQPIATRVLDAMRYGAIEPDATFGRYPDGADAIGCLATATFGQSNSGKLVGDVVINEIMYHHATRDEQYEYVELHNRGTSTISLAGWALTDGIEYTFGEDVAIAPGGYLVVAQDPNFLAAVYDNLTLGANLVGPYQGGLDDHSERIRLSYPRPRTDAEPDMITADEVTYFDGGRWPAWADGLGASLELRDPNSDNDTPEAWADSDESGKTEWTQFSYTISGSDSRYTHDGASVFDMMLLTAGEVLLDDLECVVGGANRINNSGFENNDTSWRILGNHVRSSVTDKDHHSGSRALHLIATGHGDPGANRINQSITGATGGDVTFRGWARWVRGSRFLLLRTTRELSPVRPPRPAHAFELDMPLNLGTPGRQNTAFTDDRGPEILDVRHSPVLPNSGEPIVITARVLRDAGVESVTLHHRTEGGSASFTSMSMVDDGSGDDKIAGDRIYTATITGATIGQIRSFFIEASGGRTIARFPVKLEPSAEVPERTCLIRIGDTKVASQLANYRIWMSSDVVDAFRSRSNLSNELLDCTFVYNDSEVFYNCGIRLRGSPFIRPGTGEAPQDRLGIRIDFPPDRSFRGRQEINLDATEGTSRGPLQERASYWFYAQLGMQYSRQEWVRLFINGVSLSRYDDVQKIDGDYIDAWFPGNNDGYIHKIDDYFEFNVTGSSASGEAADEGLLYDNSHPLLPDTYRWHFEKRSHPENDSWQHLYDLAVALNTPSSSSTYEKGIESKLDPVHFTKMLALRHAVGDWDSYGYTRGKNNAFYYALPEGKWYLLPWDIDFTLGSGRGSTSSLFEVTNEFPEIVQFLAYPKYKQMYFDAFKELVEGPWKTSYGTNDPPTDFDKFLDEGADLLSSEGMGDGRRNQIKQFVRERRNFILSQLPTGETDTPSRRN